MSIDEEAERVALAQARTLVKDERSPASRLWTAFVIGWLLVLVICVGLLWQTELTSGRLWPGLFGISGLAALYLWLTLRGSLTPQDLTPAGPSARALRVRLAVLAAMTALVMGLVVLMPHGGLWWLLQHAVIAAGLALPSSWAVATIGALVTLSFVSARLALGRFEPMLLIQLAFGAAAIAIRQLTITVGQLRRAREDLARLAVAEERLRFGRDLHDLLGHSLSLIVLKSELAGRLLPAAPARASAELADIERAARDALREVRATVAGYRQPVLRGELAAARDLLSAAGIQAEICDAGAALPPPLDGLLAWSVREGVTNVIRHSRAQRCAILLERVGDGARLTIRDDGRSLAHEPASVPGHGLAGLAERCAAQDARLHCGHDPAGGFRLVVEARAGAREGSNAEARAAAHERVEARAEGHERNDVARGDQAATGGAA